MEYYLTIKSFSVLTDDTIWMYLENMLNERRQKMPHIVQLRLHEMSVSYSETGFVYWGFENVL